jgi:cyanophycinase
MRTAAPVVTALVLSSLHAAAPLQAKVTRYLTGNAADVVVAAAGPGLNLGGGGLDVDAALQAMIDQARGCTDCATKVDVVVLRVTGSDGYNDYIYAMNGVDSVETLVVTRATDSNTAAVETTVRNAEVVFYAGGNQCDYTKVFKGTKVETATEFVYAKGGTVGGTSAGMAIQGEFVYNGCTASATSSEILADPYARSATFTYDYHAWNDMGDTLTDTHFVTRDRMGRLMGFLARQIKDGKTPTALGIGADEESSVVVDENGLATVMGAGNVYFVLADHFPEQCAAKKPLTYSNFKIWRVPPGGTFNLRNRPSSGYYTVSVSAGVLSGNAY